MQEYKRILRLSVPGGQSAFLWGPRKVGKSTLLKKLFPDARRFDLLLSDLFLELLREPSRLRMQIIAEQDNGRIAPGQPVIIDEIQKVPALLDEVHWLIEERKCPFILCGSSARKLKRGHANMLGGRAWRYEMRPLVSAEIPELNLLRALNNGLVPSHYDQADARKSLRAYVTDYLKEEIIAEGVTRNIPAFTRFTDILGQCNGEMITFSNIARDTGVDAKTVREYFQILEDTMIGVLVEPFSRTSDRNIIGKTPRFYLFDTGLAGYLAKTRIEEERGAVFGRAFEHFIFMELFAHRTYTESDHAISYWRTTTGHEVDFILGPADVAIEVKSSPGITSRDIRGLLHFERDYKPRRAICVTNERARRKQGPVEFIPWREFLADLWAHRVFDR